MEELRARQALLEKENRALAERQRGLGEHADQKAQLIEKTGFKLDQVEREIGALRHQIQALDVDINDVERCNARHVENQKKLLRIKDQEIQRSQEQEVQFRSNELRLKELESTIDLIKRDLDSVRYSNDALLDRNHDLKQELDSLNQHAELLNHQNRELQRELEGFVETDEMVRRNLDRKDKVQQIRSQVDEVIKKSVVDLINKSPSRARSPTYHVEEIRQSERKVAHHGQSI